MVRHATDTAVYASISTPVGPVTFTVARTMQPGSFLSGVMSTATFDSASGWHSGMSSDVRFAAMMPASRAAPSTSPFLALPDRIRSSVALLMTTRPSAIAVRPVAGFAETSTIRASPSSSMWVRTARSFDFAFLSAMILARPGGPGRIAAGEQCAGRCRDVRLSHQAFADQKRLHADPRQPREVRRRNNAALADHQAILRNQRRQRLAGFQPGLEAAQVTVVDPDQRRAKFSGAIELIAVMDLDQHVHAMRDCRSLEVARRSVVERRHDDQDAVGAVRPRLGYLPGVVHEILAQDRERGGRARRDHEVEMALEGWRVGQHREARRTAGLIGFCQRGRIEIGADQPP